MIPRFWPDRRNGKLDELSRVRQLLKGLGEPRLPLLHVYAAERLCDVGSVMIWLAMLLPRSPTVDGVGRWLAPIALVCALTA